MYRTRLIAVYAIVHKPSQRVYVGGSTHVYRRWNFHRVRLRAGLHENSRLQAAWNQDGVTAFDWRVLEEVSTKDLLVGREQYWIDTLRATELTRGFNIDPTAGSPRGRKLTDEQKRHVGAGSKGHRLSVEQRAKIAAKAIGNRRGIGNLTRFREEHSLSKETVAAVRRALAEGRRCSDVMAAFDLPRYTVERITSGVCYPDVLPELLPVIRANRPEWRRGSVNVRAKLTDERVGVILQRLARHESVAAIARDLDVSAGTISQIKCGRTWTHITRPHRA